MENSKESQIMKGTQFWTEAIKKAGVFDKIPFFNDVVTEKRPPHISAGYGEPILKDVLIDGHKVDIYHSDHKGGSWHRLFLYIKNDHDSALVEAKEILSEKRVPEPTKPPLVITTKPSAPREDVPILRRIMNGGK